jgi:5,6-dimethylbenzimidazole synthase
VLEEREVFAATLDSERAAQFADIRIEGIVDATLGIIVTYDSIRGLPGALGRHAIEDTGVYSVCLAIQNLWLAATAEGLGLGWVSFYREPFLADLIGLPAGMRPIAWLCVGPVTHFADAPDLERPRWRHRRPLDETVHWETWPDSTPQQPAAGAGAG